MEQEILIALGANLPSQVGARSATLEAALAALEAKGVGVLRRSRLYATPCFPKSAGPDYVNASAILDSDRQPAELLSILHEIETEFGRQREQRWGARSLDLDLLAVGGTVLPDVATQAEWRALPLTQQSRAVPDQLILPHPRMQERAFVLVPLCDVAPDWRHPLLDRTVRQMCDALPKEALEEVRAI